MTESAAIAGGIVLLPSDRFFIRTIPLVAGRDMAPQVTLAVESLAPFPLNQLYYGWRLAVTGDQALVFATYRKRFTSDESAKWADAAAVLPSFLALLGAPPVGPTIRLLAEGRGITVVAWDGTGSLPVAVLARETEAPDDRAERAALVAEIRNRTGLAGAPVEEFSGPVSVNAQPGGRQAVTLELAGAHALKTPLTRREVESADVRDKEFLAGWRGSQKRDLFLWRAFAAGLGGLAAMLLLEAGLFAGGGWLKGLKDDLKQQAPAVQRIETAQALSTRIEEMTQRRLMPFEMLALINQNRPGSVQFLRAATTGLLTMEIEAQTADAAAVGQYEAILRAAPALAAVETRDLRSREGLTTFMLSVTFKPESLQPGEGT